MGVLIILGMALIVGIIALIYTYFESIMIVIAIIVGIFGVACFVDYIFRPSKKELEQIRKDEEDKRTRELELHKEKCRRMYESQFFKDVITELKNKTNNYIRTSIKKYAEKNLVSIDKIIITSDNIDKILKFNEPEFIVSSSSLKINISYNSIYSDYYYVDTIEINFNKLGYKLLTDEQIYRLKDTLIVYKYIYSEGYKLHFNIKCFVNEWINICNEEIRKASYEYNIKYKNI